MENEPLVMKFEVRCHCGRLQVKYDRINDLYYCKDCGRPLMYTLVKERSWHMVSKPHSDEDAGESRVADLEKQVAELTSKLNAAEAESHSAVNRYNDLCRSYDQVTERNIVLNGQLDECEERHKADMESRVEAVREELSREAECWRKAFSEQKERTREYKDELTAAMSKNAYLEAEKKRSDALDTRGIVEMFLEFASGIYNASLDIHDAEALAEMVRARTDKVIMTAGGLGIDIRRSERGQPVGDGRADIAIKQTSDRDLDGKVCKSRQFGCTFRGDAEVGIPEKVTVWAYDRPTDPATAEPDKVPAIACDAITEDKGQTVPGPVADDAGSNEQTKEEEKQETREE